LRQENAVNQSAIKKISFVLLGLTFCITPAAAQEGKIVRIDTVRKEPLVQTVPVVGRLVARQSGVVASRISGPVDQVLVHVGDRVKKGQVIGKIVSDSLLWEKKLGEAEVAAAKATLQEATAQVTLLEQEMKRLERLRKSAAFSQARYEDKRQGVIKARSSYGSAQATLNRARASLELLKIKLADVEIVVPYSGVITKTHTEAGAYLSAGDPVITLLNDENMEVEADVPSAQTEGLTLGLPVNLKISGKYVMAVSVRAVVPEENPLTRTRPVRFSINQEATLTRMATNQSVMLDIPIGKKEDVITVHKDAVLNRKGQNIVFVVSDEKALIRPFKIGRSVGGRFEVVTGLEIGENVVVRGNERLTPGESVQVSR